VRRRVFLGRAVAASAAGIAGCAGYAWGVEPHWVEVTRHDLPIEGLPDALDGASLVQISDLHVGRDVDDRYLRRCLGRVGDLAPDLVVVTGDAVSARDGRDHGVFEQLRAVAADLPQGTLGTYAESSLFTLRRAS
jgi:predicted MPP superfamily phosphohydrolase